MTILAVIGGAAVAAIGYWISRYALVQAGDLPQRNPDLALKVAESQDWQAFDAILSPRKRDLPKS